MPRCSLDKNEAGRGPLGPAEERLRLVETEEGGQQLDANDQISSHY